MTNLTQFMFDAFLEVYIKSLRFLHKKGNQLTNEAEARIYYGTLKRMRIFFFKHCHSFERALVYTPRPQNDIAEKPQLTKYYILRNFELVDLSLASNETLDPIIEELTKEFTYYVLKENLSQSYQYEELLNKVKSYYKEKNNDAIQSQ